MSRFEPDFIFLMEVKAARNNIERVKSQLKYEGMFYVEGVNNGGGLALL